MKRLLTIGLAVVLVLAMCGAALAESDDRKITVDGKASIKVRPDVAYVSLGVQTNATEANDAQAENTRLMNATVEAIKGIGVSDKDIRTSDFNIYPQYDYQKNAISGYTASNQVTVTLRDISLVSSVIDAAVAAGANSANSVSFNVADPSTPYRQALKQAVADAKLKGAAIAEALGVSIGQPIGVTEQTVDPWGERYTYGNMNSAASYGDAGGSTPIQSGELEITARVQVVYGY